MFKSQIANCNLQSARKRRNPQSAIRLWLIPVLGLVLLGAAVALAGGGRPERADSASPEWSRGVLVGEGTLSNPPALTVDGQGRAHVVWVAGELPVSQVLRYARLDRFGVAQHETTLRLPHSMRP